MENNILQKNIAALASKFKGVVEEATDGLVLSVDAASVFEVLNEVKNWEDIPCDFLHDLAGMDKGDHFEVVYQLFSLHGRQRLRLKAKLDKENPVVDSVVSLWPGADWLEREAYDMFGIVFRGHPNLTRIYMWGDFEGFPLRKDYIMPTNEERTILRLQTAALRVQSDKE